MATDERAKRQAPTPRTLRCSRCRRGPVMTKDRRLEQTGVCSPCAEFLATHPNAEV